MEHIYNELKMQIEDRKASQNNQVQRRNFLLWGSSAPQWATAENKDRCHISNRMTIMYYYETGESELRKLRLVILRNKQDCALKSSDRKIRCDAGPHQPASSYSQSVHRPSLDEATGSFLFSHTAQARELEVTAVVPLLGRGGCNHNNLMGMLWTFKSWAMWCWDFWLLFPEEGRKEGSRQP